VQAVDGPSRGPKDPTILMRSLVTWSVRTASGPRSWKAGRRLPASALRFSAVSAAATLHPWAMKAASTRLRRANEHDAFWKYIDSIFENQGGIALATADDKLKELATAAGLDAQKFPPAPPAWKLKPASRNLWRWVNPDVNSTPSVFINGAWCRLSPIFL